MGAQLHMKPIYDCKRCVGTENTNSHIDSYMISYRLNEQHIQFSPNSSTELYPAKYSFERGVLKVKMQTSENYPKVN